MFQTKITHSQAKILGKKLGEKFGCEFNVIDAGNYVALVQNSDIGSIINAKIISSIDFFEAGIEVNEEKINKIQGIFEEALGKIHQI